MLRYLVFCSYSIFCCCAVFCSYSVFYCCGRFALILDQNLVRSGDQPFQANGKLLCEQRYNPAYGLSTDKNGRAAKFFRRPLQLRIYIGVNQLLSRGSLPRASSTLRPHRCLTRSRSRGITKRPFLRGLWPSDTLGCLRRLWLGARSLLKISTPGLQAIGRQPS